MALDVLTQLLDLPGVEVLNFTQSDKQTLMLDVQITPVATLCPTCLKPTADWYDADEPRQVRDLSLWGRTCYLRFQPRRFRCPHCQRTFTERLTWLESDQRQTHRYQAHVFRLCRKQDEHSVGQFERLTDDEVRHIFQRQAKKRSPHVNDR